MFEDQIKKIDRAIDQWSRIRTLQPDNSLQQQIVDLNMRVLSNEKGTLLMTDGTHKIIRDADNFVIDHVWKIVRRLLKRIEQAKQTGKPVDVEAIKKEVEISVLRKVLEKSKKKAQKKLEEQQRRVLPVKAPDPRLW